MSTSAVPLRPRTLIAIAVTSIAGLVAFGWPLIAAPSSSAVAHAGDAPWIFALFVPLLIVVMLAELSDGALNAKSVAMLGVLSAVITAIRPLGGGVAGLEPMWAVLILGGRALGPGFGFCLGSISMFSSALITGGVGPWLPFQMLGAAWVGLGAGLLPAASGKKEILLCRAYGAVACLGYGLLLNLWFWPFTAGLARQLAYVPGAPISENLLAWLRFDVVTSLGFDVPRAILTVMLIVIAGRPVLLVLRRMARKAAFGTTVSIAQVTH